ncbi:MAG: SDR family oxidoreductase [Bacteroidetes bacterium]|nr:SDR family oxidoreductase [Bacteroidota bacterium]
MSKTILVTGATGNIAGLVIPELIKQGATVKAFVHDASKAEKIKEAGAEIIEGEYSDQDALNSAAEGVDAVLSITPPNPDAVSQAANIIEAAKKSGSPFFLRCSAIGAAADAPTENGKFHFETDEAVIASGLTYTILRPHFFMQNTFMSVDSIMSEGNMYLGMGEGKLGMIDVRDIADCCVKILLEGGHDSKIYTPTGPDSISFSEIAKIIGEGIKKEVTYVPVTYEDVRKAILDMGWGEWGAKVMADYSKAYSEGWGDFTTDDVETITGNKSRSYKQFFDEVLTWGFNKPSES